MCMNDEPMSSLCSGGDPECRHEFKADPIRPRHICACGASVECDLVTHARLEAEKLTKLKADIKRCP